jgi:hypothetical protein
VTLRYLDSDELLAKLGLEKLLAHLGLGADPEAREADGYSTP